MTSADQRLGDLLREAREARGLALERVQRDIHIRVAYLAALERGEYRALPDRTHGGGFVRNYATYLGVDVYAAMDLYRAEIGGRPEVPPTLGPLPLHVGRGSSALVTRARVAGCLAVLLVAALVGYLGYEFVTFARTPELRVTQPAGDVVDYLGTSYLVRGTTVSNGRITISGLRENPSIVADESGHFAVRVQLVPGSNVVTVVASDPLTGRDSEAVRRTITVTLPASRTFPT